MPRLVGKCCSYYDSNRIVCFASNKQRLSESVNCPCVCALTDTQGVSVDSDHKLLKTIQCGFKKIGQ